MPSRARAKRREIRPRKRTKGGDKGKRRPRDTRTMEAEQWADAGNLTDDRKCPPFVVQPTIFHRALSPLDNARFLFVANPSFACLVARFFSSSNPN